MRAKADATRALDRRARTANRSRGSEETQTLNAHFLPDLFMEYLTPWFQSRMEARFGRAASAVDRAALL